MFSSLPQLNSSNAWITAGLSRLNLLLKDATVFHIKKCIFTTSACWSIAQICKKQQRSVDSWQYISPPSLKDVSFSLSAVENAALNPVSQMFGEKKTTSKAPAASKEGYIYKIPAHTAHGLMKVIHQTGTHQTTRSLRLRETRPAPPLLPFAFSMCVCCV